MPDVPIGAGDDWVRSWSASISERAAAAQALSDRVGQLSVSASDRYRTITVTVDGSGAMIGLWLAPEAGQQGMERLAGDILQTMRRAQANITDQVAGIAAQTVGADSETGRAVVSSFELRFPPEPEIPADPTGQGSYRG